MLALALDTTLDRTAVAVTDGRRLAVVRAEAMDRGHAERLLPMVADALAEAGVAVGDVERIVVAVGPGSFTGIRIGLAAARGLALATGAAVVGVGTLEALAASCPERVDGPVLAAVDARRGEIYAALCTASGAPLEAPVVSDSAGVAETLLGRAGAVVGSGGPIVAHEAAVRGLSLPPVFPLAGPDPLVLARLGLSRDVPDRPPGPVYLRAPDARPQVADAELRA